VIAPISGDGMAPKRCGIVILGCARVAQRLLAVGATGWHNGRL